MPKKKRNDVALEEKFDDLHRGLAFIEEIFIYVIDG